MKRPCRPLCHLLAALSASCATWNPAAERTPENAPPPGGGRGGVTATFLGNTTLLVTDGDTRLLVDGFVSRPGSIRTLIGTIGPDEDEIGRWLGPEKIGKVDAILVGHAHHDHALDAPTLSRLHEAPVIGSRAYGFIHRGHLGPANAARFREIQGDRAILQFGRFTVTFTASGHVESQNPLQAAVDGDIRREVPPKAHYTRYKCGKVYAIHLAHPDGDLAVTTTAGSLPDQFSRMKADVVFLGIGLLPENGRDTYWQQTVEVLDAPVVVPTHWDDFTHPLDRGLHTRPRWQENSRDTFRWLREKSAGRRLIVLDAHEKLRLRDHRLATSCPRF